jgi:hypothetical protein
MSIEYEWRFNPTFIQSRFFLIHGPRTTACGPPPSSESVFYLRANARQNPDIIIFKVVKVYLFVKLHSNSIQNP